MSNGPQERHAAFPPRGACGLPAGSDGVGGRFLRPVAALFVRADSIYKTMPGVDAWDIERDARKWPGGCPVVAHPPCRAWGRLRQFAKPRYDEKELGPWAVEMVRRWGGVLEHPSESSLWIACAMPRPGRAPDQFGGWTAEVRQCDWGHKAEKLTWLYIVGAHPDQLPVIPPRAEPTHVVRGDAEAVLPSISKAEREHTPPALAQWLVDLARSCEVHAATVRPRESGGISSRDAGFRTA